jgi:hypothetical protein
MRLSKKLDLNIWVACEKMTRINKNRSKLNVTSILDHLWIDY